jgi:hypothetical protein
LRTARFALFGLFAVFAPRVLFARTGLRFADVLGLDFAIRSFSCSSIVPSR